MEIKYFKKDKIDQPMIIYREKAYATIKKYMNSTHAKTKEFMFYGLVEKRVGNIFIIDRFELMPNKATSGAYCEADDERMSTWFMETFTDPKDMKRVRCHAHSHVNMGTTPSGTDDAEILRLASHISDYYIQLIVNHKDENTCNIFDAVTGISYIKVPQYIQIGNYLSDFKEGDIYNWDEETLTMSSSQIKIEDGQYEVKGNWLHIDENLSLNLLSREFVLDGDELCIEGGSIAFYETDEEEKEIEALFKDMIKAPTYTYSGYGGSYYNGTTYGSKDSKTTSTPSKTPSGGWGYDDSGYDDDDDDDFYEKYYNGGYKGYAQSRGMLDKIEEEEKSNSKSSKSSKSKEKSAVTNLHIKK